MRESLRSSHRATRLPTRPLLLWPVVGVLLVLAAGGCSQSLKSALLPNERPTVRLTYAPVDTTQAEFYVYRIHWTGFDSDGRVARFEYAVDPPSAAGADTEWTGTTTNEQLFRFAAATPGNAGSPEPLARDFHVFAIRAVDNRGDRSPVVSRAFYSFCVAPTVQILIPTPSELLTPTVPPKVRITWTGQDFTDATGSVSEPPLYYKYKLYPYGPDIPWSKWLMCPDSLRAAVAPAFAGWDSTGPDSAFADFLDLDPNNQYLFVVVAFGRSGAYSSDFSLNTNMLRMFVGAAEGPRLTLFNSYFSYTYAWGGFPVPLDPTWAIHLQVPAGVPVVFRWSAMPTVGSAISGYRWALDIESLDDETPRSDPDDWAHWSDWSLATSATIGPFDAADGELHDFYVEVRDVLGVMSLGWIQFQVVAPTFDRDLLVVNDTRFAVDMVSRTQPAGRTDSLQAPTGVWPNRAELDTFLFAVGGVRWQMTPAGRLSEPGLFRGYAFDTLGTRYAQENPTVPLSVLGQYRHIVWMVDAAGSRLTTSPLSATLPMTTLRYMCSRNRENTLATWVGEGGELWALGGGFGNATNEPWNNTNNDNNGVRTYSSTLPTRAQADLTPGRFMYDLTHWRSEFRVFKGMFRFARLDQRDPQYSVTDTVCWQGEPLPDARYYMLPAALSARSPATDPLPPYRTPVDYYVGNPAYTNGINIEFLSAPNHIREGGLQALDTLYLAYGRAYPLAMLQRGAGVNAVMTYYHGQDNAPLVFSGTSIWDFRRTDCQGLVDFVLQRLWGMSKGSVIGARPAVAGAPSVAVPAGGATARASVGTHVPAPARGPAQQPAGSPLLRRRR